MKKLLLGIVFYFCTTLFSFAQVTITGISGTVANKQTVTVSGSGFGTKIPAAPFLWDDFESGQIGNTIGNPVIGKYTQVGHAKYDSTRHASGSKSALSEIRNNSVGPGGLVSNWIPDKRKMAFASMKIYIESQNFSKHNIKLFRLNASDPDPTHGYPNYNIGKERTALSMSGIVNHGRMGQTYQGGISNYATNTWNSHSIYDKLGDAGVANGFVGRRYNNNLFHANNITTLLSQDSASGLRSAYFCAYFSHDSADANYWIDDVYADTTLARIELHDGPNYTSSNSEIQIPTAWAANSLSFTVNQGSFSDCDTAYLFIIDRNGNYNTTGFPVIINQPSCIGAGIENTNTAENILIHPNPFTNVFTIDYTQTQAADLTIEIINMLGELVFAERIAGYSGKFAKQISLNNQTPGIYLVKVSSDDFYIEKKIVKE